LFRSGRMENKNIVPWLLLKSVSGIGDVACRRLVERFGSPSGVFSASEEELLGVEGIGPRLCGAIRSAVVTPEIDREIERLGRGDVRVCTILEGDYPEGIRQIHDPPPFLYLKGEFRPEDRLAVGVVGSRRCTEYGRGIAYRLGWDLASRGFTVVSGLARGIDTAAHLGALEAGGRTIGVLGSGLGIPHPTERELIKKSMEERGVLVSEFPMNAAPDAVNFPKRNRLISGLSLGVVVVEAAERSGAMITASFALEQGREVFAVPGPIGSETSRGTHRLIKQGAKLVEGVEDILEELQGSRPTISLPSGVRARPGGEAETHLTDEEEKVYTLLSHTPCPVDDLIARADLAASTMAGLLLQLELKGKARQLPGLFYIRGNG
jgi:DNA processing protein